MAVTTANKTYANVTTEGNYRRDVADDLFHIEEPTSYPLFNLKGGKAYYDGKTEPTKVSGMIKSEKAIQ